MIPYTEGRLLVPTPDDRGVIPDAWLESWGHVLLPACWTEERWAETCKEDKRFAYQCVASLPFYFWNIHMPWKSLQEMGWDKATLDRIYPNGMPEFWRDSLRAVQTSLPYELLATERKPTHSNIWRLGWCEPTGHGKSMRFMEGLPSYLIGINPSVTILAATSTSDVGGRYITSAKDQITRNERYQWLFGYLHDENTSGERRVWRTDAIEVERPLSRAAHTLETVGYLCEIEGERFDVGLGDDIATLDNCRTPAAREQMWNWWTGVFIRRLNADRRFCFYSGSPKWARDITDRIKEEAATKGTWIYREKPAILEGTWPPPRKDPTRDYSVDNIEIPTDCKVLWPEFWPIERLVEDFVESPHSFARTRLLVHLDEETKWFSRAVINDISADGGVRSDGTTPKPLLSRWPEDVGVPRPGTGLYEQYCAAGLNPELFRLVMSIDLAADEPSKNYTDPDYTVFQLWGMHRETFIRVLLNQRRFRYRDPAKIQQVMRTFVGAYHPSKIICEALSLDKLFARGLPQVLGEPVSLSSPRGIRTEMIERVRDLADNGLILVPFARDTFSGNTARNYNTRQVMAPFLDELENYGARGHDDTLLCAAHALWDIRGGDSNLKLKVLRPELKTASSRDIPTIRTLRRRRRAGTEAELDGMERRLSRLYQDLGTLKAQAHATGTPILPPETGEEEGIEP